MSPWCSRVSTYECDRKGKDVDDAQRERSLVHRTLLVQVDVEVAALGAHARREASTVLVGDAAQDDDTADEGADEEEVDEGDEHGIVSGGCVGDDGRDDPAEGETGDDEEDENVVGGELVDVGVSPNPVALQRWDQYGARRSWAIECVAYQHAHNRDGHKQLKDSP